MNLTLYFAGLPGKLKEFLEDRLSLLAGDRDVEWTWVAGNIPQGPGRALDFGPGRSNMALVAARRGFQVTAIDLNPSRWRFLHPGIRFEVGDILTARLPTNSFDLVICCSSVEHVGLSGRYGVSEDRKMGDIEAMRQLYQVLKPSGLLLLTIPVGLDAIFPPLHRVYGEKRLPLLLDKFEITKEEYWSKEKGVWTITSKQRAMQFVPRASRWYPSRSIYALGCFCLRRRPN